MDKFLGKNKKNWAKAVQIIQLWGYPVFKLALFGKAFPNKTFFFNCYIKGVDENELLIYDTIVGGLLLIREGLKKINTFSISPGLLGSVEAKKRINLKMNVFNLI